MRSLTHLTLLCAASSAGASVLRPRLDALIDELGDALGEVVDDVVDGIKVIISKIPLSEFGQMAAVHLQDVIKDPSLIDSLYAAVPSSDQAATRDLEETVPRAAAASTRQAAAPTCDAASLSTRVEWRDYTPEDRLALVDAIACLITTPSAGPDYAPSTSRYEDLVRTHQLLTNDVHMNGVFLLWHRYYLHAFETALRAECGFDRPLPWWDETLDAGAFKQSSVFTPEHFGSLPSSVDGSGVCITDGRFANLTCNIGPGPDSTPHCLSRAGDEDMTAEASQEFVDYCAEETVFGPFSECAETGYVFSSPFRLHHLLFFFLFSLTDCHGTRRPHAWAHNGIGSVMAERYASPSDPIFFLHHLFVDHQYASWQAVNATARTTKVDGACMEGSAPCTTPVTLDTVLAMNGLVPDVTVGEVLDTQGGVLCYTYDRLVKTAAS